MDLYGGIDLGQAQDPTALAVVERAQATAFGRRVNRYAVRGLKRWPLGTKYPDIVAEVRALWGKPPLQGRPLAADQTGVGRPVVDLFRAPMRDALGAALPVPLVVPITITGGQQTTGDTMHLFGGFGVPKKELVAALQVPLQSGRLDIPADHPQAAVLARELANFRVKVSAAAHESFNARDGEHDDLLLALAMAVWLAEVMNPASAGGAPRTGSPLRSQVRDAGDDGKMRFAAVPRSVFGG
jgi:hypothetical protein